MTTAEMLAHTIDQYEGGFVDHSSDRGGPTAYGITQAALSLHRGRSVGAHEVAALTKPEAIAIYQQQYVIAPGFAQVPDWRLRYALIDWGIHSGPQRPIRTWQAMLGVEVDGIIGPVTLAASTDSDLSDGEQARKLTMRRLHDLAGILQRDHSQRVFAAGWMHRLADLGEVLA